MALNGYFKHTEAFVKEIQTGNTLQSRPWLHRRGIVQSLEQRGGRCVRSVPQGTWQFHKSKNHDEHIWSKWGKNNILSSAHISIRDSNFIIVWIDIYTICHLHLCKQNKHHVHSTWACTRWFYMHLDNRLSTCTCDINVYGAWCTESSDQPQVP